MSYMAEKILWQLSGWMKNSTYNSATARIQTLDQHTIIMGKDSHAITD